MITSGNFQHVPYITGKIHNILCRNCGVLSINWGSSLTFKQVQLNFIHSYYLQEMFSLRIVVKQNNASVDGTIITQQNHRIYMKLVALSRTYSLRKYLYFCMYMYFIYIYINCFEPCPILLFLYKNKNIE